MTFRILLVEDDRTLRLEAGTNPGWFALGKESIPELDVLAADIKAMIVATPGVANFSAAASPGPSASAGILEVAVSVFAA